MRATTRRASIPRCLTLKAKIHLCGDRLHVPICSARGRHGFVVLYAPALLFPGHVTSWPRASAPSPGKGEQGTRVHLAGGFKGQTVFVFTEKPMDGKCELLKNIKHNCWEIVRSG